IAHAIKRYIRIGFDLNSGADIENSSKGVRGTRIANLQPNRMEHVNVKTLSGVSNWFNWRWPKDGDLAGYIQVRELPYIASIQKPTPTNTPHSIPKTIWTMPQLRNPQNYSLYKICFYKSYLIQLLAQPLELTFELSKGWALKGNQKYGQKGGGNRMSIQITSLLESFFLAGEANKTRKYTAETMLGKLNGMVEEDEIDKNEVPKLQTIRGWISTYAAVFKKKNAKRTLSEITSTQMRSFDLLQYSN
ncbi:7902_t:CDS:2, partial [Entrophospora sp. SA101]